MSSRRYLVAGGSGSVPIDVCSHGPLIDPGRYRTLHEAHAEAERYVAEGLRGVAIQDFGAVLKIWPMCKTVVISYTLPGGRYWPTHWCGRHDLLDDGRCPEHTEGGRPVETARQLAFEVTP